MSLADRILRTESKLFTRQSLLAEKHIGFDKLKKGLAHKNKFKAMDANSKKSACYDESMNAIAEIAALSESLVSLKESVIKSIKK